MYSKFEVEFLHLFLFYLVINMAWYWQFLQLINLIYNMEVGSCNQLVKDKEYS